MTSAYPVTWWNVEVLRDGGNSPRRDEKPARAPGESIVSQAPALRDREIGQLVSVPSRTNAGAGSGPLVICPELPDVRAAENEFVGRGLPSGPMPV
ncbi:MULTISPECIES: hypothetical protein [Protofrankia]|uniref:Endonuclease/exonuclease/phosphatase n=1 Tax=Candidatus Protofrankia datiscae TaxID=2716812 RepID=F8B1L3_9ACTN|nr:MULTISPECIES: hypothetical protein [Protofrankia]AEH10766.1 endonuclease/exonuclease/phosphatase [Candidatus Protofrankia datiscae]